MFSRVTTTTQAPSAMIFMRLIPSDTRFARNSRAAHSRKVAGHSFRRSRGTALKPVPGEDQEQGKHLDYPAAVGVSRNLPFPVWPTSPRWTERIPLCVLPFRRPLGPRGLACRLLQAK